MTTELDVYIPFKEALKRIDEYEKRESEKKKDIQQLNKIGGTNGKS